MILPIFKLEDYLSAREFDCDIMFSGSDMETFKMQDLLSYASPEMLTAWDKLELSYTQPKGHPLLLNELNKKYLMPNEYSHICTFNGAEEGIYATLSTLLKKEDHVIVFTPCYQSLKEIPRNICEISELEANFIAGKCFFDLTKLNRLIKKNTKMLIINFPHNPSGIILSKQELNEVIAIAKKHDLYIFSDEVYRGLEINSNDRLPYLATCYPKGISLGVMSKAYGLPGLRIGWIVSQDPKVIDLAANLKHYLTICNSAPSEILAIIALQNEDKIFKRNKEILENNLPKLRALFTSYTNLFEWYEPQGGCIAFPKLNLNMSAYEFCEKLSKSKKIQLLPGTVFDAKGNHFRVGFGRKNMPEALKRLEEFICEENLL